MWKNVDKYLHGYESLCICLHTGYNIKLGPTFQLQIPLCHSTFVMFRMHLLWMLRIFPFSLLVRCIGSFVWYYSTLLATFEREHISKQRSIQSFRLNFVWVWVNSWHLPSLQDTLGFGPIVHTIPITDDYFQNDTLRYDGNQCTNSKMVLMCSSFVRSFSFHWPPKP